MSDLIRVLVAEDETLAHVVLEDILGEGGFTAIIGADAAEAISMLGAEGADFRALVTDINLGSKLAGRAREIMPDIPVATCPVLTTQAAQGVPKSTMISKPYAPAQLVTAVSQRLNGPRPSRAPVPHPAAMLASSSHAVIIGAEHSIAELCPPILK